MNSARPTTECTAGQETVDSGIATFNGALKFSNAEFAFALDWLSGRSARRSGCRDAGHRPATGEAAA